MARLYILRDFEILKWKHTAGCMIKFSDLGEELNTVKPKSLVKEHHANHPTEYHLQFKGISNFEISSA